MDLTSIEVLVQGKGWVTMDNKFSGQIDLLQYNNGLDLLIANRSFEFCKLIKIRLILGENNFIVKNGVFHTLILPLSAQDGIEIDIDSDLNSIEKVEEWIDIDVGKSVTEQNDGSFIFNPVIRTFKKELNGRIKGYVFPFEALPYVQAIKGNDTLTAIPNEDGFYQFSGLQGAYKLKFIPSIGTYNTIITNPINVTSNQIQVYDTIIL
ncbi:MAG: DUF4382 domain-containing protein [Fluviicola sp.]